ncbi:hypothetical protein ACOI22_06155 [Glaciecola sp. 2405UD65-10]|uniref:hypothetical protein n=1 Tax=Glaciecola sp. 2405UD65-10 TaxID=3397244 RepID=UPI003B5C0D39
MLSNKNQYKFVEGMQMHPFSDQSGLAFYDPRTTVLSSIAVPLSTLNEWMAQPTHIEDEQQQALEQLCFQGFIYLNTTEN